MAERNLSPRQVLQILRGADPDDVATIKMPVNAGAAVRGQFRRNLEVGCFQAGVACDIVKQRGFLSTAYFVTLKGDASRMIPIVEWIERVVG